jgi:hypothetical protein
VEPFVSSQPGTEHRLGRQLWWCSQYSFMSSPREVTGLTQLKKRQRCSSQYGRAPLLALSQPS